MKIKVQYTTMIVNDLEESVAFYRDVLGFSEGYHVDLPVGGAMHLKPGYIPLVQMWMIWMK